MIRRPPKVPEITNRIAAPVEIEQYHQMCARTQIIIKTTVLSETKIYRELGSRARLAVPGRQEELLEEVEKTGKPVT